VVSHELGPRADLPPYILIPNQTTPYAGTGYLGAAYGRLPSQRSRERQLCRPRPHPFRTASMRNISAERREMRFSVVDAHFSALEKSDALDGMDSFYQRAYAMISSDKARARIRYQSRAGETPRRYGRNAAGQRMLARTAFGGSGVRFVSLTYGSWDHHDNIKAQQHPDAEFRPPHSRH